MSEGPRPELALADALRAAAQALEDAVAEATTAHAAYHRQLGAERSWHHLDAVAGQVRSRRADVGFYATSQLVEHLRAEAEDAAIRFPDLSLAGEVLPPTPPDHEPEIVARWWRELSGAEQRLVIERLPRWVGRADGLPMRVRHEANLRLLDAEIERRTLAAEAPAEAGAERGLTPEEERDLRGLLKIKQLFTPTAELDASEAAALAEVTTPLPERFLYLLDARSYPLKTAIVHGDLDQARYVVLHVPGATTTVDLRLFREAAWMSALRDETARFEVDPAQVAIVDWIGYHAPVDIATRRRLGDSGMKVLVPGEASDERYAREAAPWLAECARGLRAIAPPGARLVASGHSYGASVFGLALQQTDVCDAAMVCGCPGLFVQKASALKLPAGALYAAVAPADVVGVLGIFGGDVLAIKGIQQLSPLARAVSTGSGWAFLRMPLGHESYYSRGTTLLYSLAAIVVGRTEKVRTYKARTRTAERELAGTPASPTGLSQPPRAAQPSAGPVP